jgi:hypothetical protein
MGKALDDLAWWLRTYHPTYTVDDIRPSRVKGYLRTTKPCTCRYPPFDGYTNGIPSGGEQPHYHTLDVEGHRPEYGRGIYAWWRAIVQELGENPDVFMIWVRNRADENSRCEEVGEPYTDLTKAVMEANRLQQIAEDGHDTSMLKYVVSDGVCTVHTAQPRAYRVHRPARGPPGL